METNQNIRRLTDHLFRQESGKMVAVLTKIFGTEHLQLAEDVVQDTLLQALETWKLKGAPDNPPAWLYRVAKNKAIDIVRRNKFSVQYDFSDNERKLLQSEYTLLPAMEQMWKDEVIQDDLLRMMFACCHPDISRENQITLILKTLCGLSTSEIAKSFLTTEETISKRLYRTKEFFRQRKIRPQFPAPDLLKHSANAVLKAIYLIFNEGYNSTHSDTTIRKDLLEQAIYLCNLLCGNHHTQVPEVYAAMALMCFHAARTDSRLSREGEIILLPMQDRSKWDANLIADGRNYLGRAAFGDEISSYHIEAAIAYEHCSAPTFEQTNWSNILYWYTLLCQVAPSPVVQLNRLTVLGKVHGNERLLREIEQVENKPELETHFLYHSLLGELYAASAPIRARACFHKAMQLTQSHTEKKILQRKIDALSIE